MELNIFSGEYYYLSSNAPIEIEDSYAEATYPTLEHAFLACKTLNEAERRKIALIKDPTTVRAIYTDPKNLTTREDWEEIKEEVMLEILRIKFTSDNRYGRLLLATYPATLFAGSCWKEIDWQVCGEISNERMVELFMKVREELVNEGSK